MSPVDRYRSESIKQILTEDCLQQNFLLFHIRFLYSGYQTFSMGAKKYPGCVIQAIRLRLAWLILRDIWALQAHNGCLDIPVAENI